MKPKRIRSLIALVATVCILGVSSLALAQSSMETIGGTFPADGELLSRVIVTNDVAISAFDYMIEYDPDVLQLEEVISSPILQAIIDFEMIDEDPSAGLYRHTVTLTSPLAAGVMQELSTARYTAALVSLGPSPLAFYDTPGGPPLAVLVDAATGGAIFSLVTEGEAEVLPPTDPNYVLSFQTDTLVLDDQNEFQVVIENTGSPLTGWSFGVAWDTPEVAPEIIQLGDDVLALQGGMGPDFAMTTFETQGFTHQATVDFDLIATLPPGPSAELLNIVVFASASAPEAIDVFFTPDFGVSVIVFPEGGLGSTPDWMTISLTTALSFDRGDCNSDGGFDVADPTFGLSYLFSSGSEPTCEDACDANDDGGIDLSDSVSMLSALFAGGPMPPGSGECNPDAQVGSDPLGCDQFLACP